MECSSVITRVFLSLAVLIVAPRLVSADIIFGTIVFKSYGTIDPEKQEASRLGIAIKCPKNNYSGSTGERGSYRIFVDEEGKCSIEIVVAGKALTSEVRSYDEPVRYDFAIVKGPVEGDYSLVRN